MALAPTLAGLTEQQAKFVSAYLKNPSASEAALLAGYSHREAGYAVLRTPTVQKALADARARLIETEGATIAYNTLIDLMKPGNQGSVRLGAAKYLMDAAGHGAKPAGAQEKSLQDMTADELAATIAKLDEAMAAHGDKASPVKRTTIEG